MKALVDDTIDGKYIAVLEDDGDVFLVVKNKKVYFSNSLKYETKKEFAIKLFDKIFELEKLYIYKDVNSVDDLLKGFDVYSNNVELFYLELYTNSKEFSEKEVFELVNTFKFYSLVCYNEKLGEKIDGYVTIKVGIKESEYIGEFIGKEGESNFEFIFY